MHRTFNMGVGMVIVCSRDNVASITAHLRERDNKCYEIGEVSNVPEGDQTVSID
jgi:phosphoribosylaminoimidazole (AIR) synthetase